MKQKSKFIIVIMIVLILILLQFSFGVKIVNAETVSGSEGDVNWSFDTDTKTVTFSGNGAISKKWSYDIKESEVHNVVINEGITSIEYGAFSECHLTSIIVEDKNPNYSSIDGVLFNKDKTEIICCPGRKSQKSYIIPNSVIEVGPYAFANCFFLQNITIPNSVTSIGESAFKTCHRLTSIIIPNSVTSIGSSAFVNCGLKSITIPNSVTSIGSSAFSICYSLTSIIVEDKNPNYSSMDGVLFNKDKTEIICYPSGKSETYIIPNSVTSIGLRAFAGCSHLTNITIPNSVTSIGESAFKTCHRLTSIIIPNSVTSIGSYAFYDLRQLTSITIPNSVTNIGEYAFSGSSSLTIYCKSNSTALKYATDKNIKYVIDDDAPIIVKVCQEREYINIEATDSGVGLSSEPYSIDGQNWYGNNKVAVEKSGEYKAFVRDLLDNIAEKSITVDIDKPSITNVAVNGYKITVAATDNVALADKAYSIDGVNYQSNNIFTVTKNGIYTIYVKDAQGNIANKTATVNVDIEAPSITNIAVNGYKITITATDNVTLAEKAYSIDKENWQSSNEIIVTEDGTYIVYVKDAQGNIASKSVVVKTKEEDKKDTEAPSITNIAVNGYKITITATDNVALAKRAYSIDKENWQSGNEIIVTEDGTYTVYVRDGQGNIASKSVVVKTKEEDKKDTEAPTITNIAVNGYKITVTATDNVALAEKAYSIDKENWQSGNEIVVTKTGRYMVYVRDKSGNISSELVVIEGKNNNSAENGNGDNSNKGANPTNQDNSQSKNILPQTGEISIIFIIVIVTILSVIIFKRIKKMKF